MTYYLKLMMSLLLIPHVLAQSGATETLLALARNMGYTTFADHVENVDLRFCEDSFACQAMDDHSNIYNSLTMAHQGKQ